MTVQCRKDKTAYLSKEELNNTIVWLLKLCQARLRYPVSTASPVYVLCHVCQLLKDHVMHSCVHMQLDLTIVHEW